MSTDRKKGGKKVPETSQDIKTFQNPSGYWFHDGSFSVELTENTDKSRVPLGAKIEGDVIRVESGRIKQTMGGIQFYANGVPFTWKYERLKVIRDGDGKLLWVNKHYR